MIATAHPSSSSAAASTHGAATHALELLEARRQRDALKLLLIKEQAAMAEFLVALADFDRRRGWEALGHSSLFAFLHVELRFPNPSAFWRMSAARVLQRFPDLVEPLRDGRLCCSATAELAKVLTEENRAEVLPRFYGLSAREAQELVAELQPREAPATRTIVTNPSRPPVAQSLPDSLPLAPHPDAAPASGLYPNVVPPTQLRTSEVDFGGVARSATQLDQIEPLSGERRRLHVSVSRVFVKKLEAARSGLSHAMPAATMEDVLEAALDLLLEKQAKARGQVKRPRTTLPVAPRVEGQLAGASPQPSSLSSSVARPEGRATDRRTGPREAIPAAVRRAVWERDAGRCTWPLDSGGCCGSTHRLELDHLVPWALGGESTVDNLRIACGRHNTLAARQAFGARCVERYARGRGGAGS